MPRLLFQKPDETSPVSIQFSEAYKRYIKVCEANYMRIGEPNTSEKAQMIHCVNKANATKPEYIITHLVNICRTKIRDGQFEDQDSNIVNGPDAPREGLSILIWEMVVDENSLKMGNPIESSLLSSDTYILGKYRRPTFKITTDNRGNIIKSEQIGVVDCWYWKYTPEKAKEILSKYKKDKNFIMTVSEDGYSQRTVFNEKEFIEGSIDDLIEANKGDLATGKSYLKADCTYGGLNRYLADKAKRDKEGHSSSNNSVRPTKKRHYSKPEENTTNANSS